jgi:Flp pilus assembly protein TadD
MRVNRLIVSVFAIALLVNSCGLLPGIVSDAQYEFDQGLALFNGGRYEEAAGRFRRATELDPNFGRAYFYLGRSYVSLKRWREALSPLRTAYRLSPDETKREAFDILIDALFAVGVEDFRAGDFGSAIERFREILGLQPASARGRSELVRALVAHGGDLLSEGNIPQAISVYTDAVKLTPNNFDALFGLAKSFLRNGEFSNAWQAAQQAVNVEPGNREVQSFLQQLQKR